MWQQIHYKSFEIYVLAIHEHHPMQKKGKYSYNGHVCRPGADPRFLSQASTFFHRFPDFETKEAAWDAGQYEGKTIVDGTHPFISVEHL